MQQLPSKLISGKELAAPILNDLSQQVEELRQLQLRLPCLAVVLVGAQTDSLSRKLTLVQRIVAKVQPDKAL